MESVVLKPGKDKALRNRHHWIFSGAIDRWPEFENGSVLQVRSAGGELLGCAYFNRNCSIAGRMVSFGKREPESALRDNFRQALSLRRRFFDPVRTNGVRIVNAEGDGIPGLVVDSFADVVVLQVGTLGMEKLKPLVLEEIERSLGPRAVYEKSTLSSRAEEGLPLFESILSGPEVGRIRIVEEGIEFWIDIPRSQKTGFYLDQREMRKVVARFAGGRRVLNAFSYTGAFSVYALKGGALFADSVDSSSPALELARENFEINGLSSGAGSFHAADVFDYLRETDKEYDFIILDPPAFAKKKTDVVQACRGYKDINRLAFQKVGREGLVLTFSCSHFVDVGLFQKVVFQAAQESGRSVRILQRHIQAVDHPINIYHPETAYLKGLLLFVD